MAKTITAYHEDRSRRERREELEALRRTLAPSDTAALAEVDRRIAILTTEIERDPFSYNFV